MIRKRLSANGNKIVVTFEIPGSVWADCIHLVGDLNDWDRECLPLRHTSDDVWQLEVELEPGCEVHFRYLVDGAHWRSDRHADAHVTGDDGACDSVVIAQLPQAA